MFVDEGESSASFLPSWPNLYYAELMNANHQYVATTASSNFHPTVEQVEEILPSIQLLALNSPLNPTGTVIEPSVLEGISRAVVAENNRRRGTGQRPVMMLFDQVYWMLVAEGYVHKSPVQLVPEVAPYVVHTDAISKCLPLRALRVGLGGLASGTPTKDESPDRSYGSMGSLSRANCHREVSAPTRTDECIHGRDA